MVCVAGNEVRGERMETQILDKKFLRKDLLNKVFKHYRKDTISINEYLNFYVDGIVKKLGVKTIDEALDKLRKIEREEKV